MNTIFKFHNQSQKYKYAIFSYKPHYFWNKLTKMIKTDTWYTFHRNTHSHSHKISLIRKLYVYFEAQRHKQKIWQAFVGHFSVVALQMDVKNRKLNFSHSHAPGVVISFRRLKTRNNERELRTRLVFFH